MHQCAFGVLRGSPGARTYDDAMRARNIGHHAALRQLANRFVGVLHGCLKTRSVYNEDRAGAHHQTPQRLDKTKPGMSADMRAGTRAYGAGCEMIR